MTNNIIFEIIFPENAGLLEQKMRIYNLQTSSTIQNSFYKNKP